MGSVKITSTPDQQTLLRVDELVAVAEKLPRKDQTRLATECLKLDPQFERALAEAGLGQDMESWPEY